MPAPVIVPSFPDLRLRSATDADHAFLRRLFDDSRAGQFMRTGLSGPVLDRLLDQQFRLQRSGHAAQFPVATSLVVERRGEPIGRLLLDCNSERWHVVDIALLIADRGQGVGTDLMRSVEAAARNATTMLTLMVLESNAPARRLYAKLGFTEGGPATGGGYLALSRRLDR